MTDRSNPGGGVVGAPIGSVEWAQRIRLELRANLDDIHKVPDQVIRAIEVLRWNDSWRLLNKEDDTEFSSFEEFFEYEEPWGLGRPIALVRPYLEARKNHHMWETEDPILTLMREVASAKEAVTRLTQQVKSAEERYDRSCRNLHEALGRKLDGPGLHRPAIDQASVEPAEHLEEDGTSTSRERILETLRKSGEPMKVADLAIAVFPELDPKLRPKRLATYLTRLTKRGEVRNLSRGVWALAEPPNDPPLL